MNDTPETDAKIICSTHRSFKGVGGVVVSEFSRRLERERDEARKAAQQWRRLFFLQWAVAYDQPLPPSGQPPFPWEAAQ